MDLPEGFNLIPIKVIKEGMFKISFLRKEFFRSIFCLAFDSSVFKCSRVISSGRRTALGDRAFPRGILRVRKMNTLRKLNSFLKSSGFDDSRLLMILFMIK